ncbi:S-adenosyl-L-methionine-dependent methyltransferase [Cryptosporidium felis]|nr:S-adenosyl-L-methionine-dependent methyltransferase [Cryptosporidium felis]
MDTIFEENKGKDFFLNDGETNELSFLEDFDRTINSSLEGSYITNKLAIIKGNLSSWLNLLSNSSHSIKSDDILLKSLLQKKLFRGIFFTRRITNLPIRYSNMPGSIIPKLCKKSLYTVSERFPCTPLNESFEKSNGERINLEDNGRDISELETVLFSVENNSKEFEKDGLLVNKKRKKEIKGNVDFLKQKLSIFPGNLGREFLIFQKYDEGILLDKNAVMDATPEILAQHIARRLRCCTILDACGGVGGNTIAFSQHCKRVVSVEISNSRTLISKHNSQIYGLYGTSNINHSNGDEHNTFVDSITPSGISILPFNVKHNISKEKNLFLYFDPNSNISFVNGSILDFCDWYLKQSNLNNFENLDNISYSTIKEAFREFNTFEWAFASPPWGGYSYNRSKEFNLENTSSINYKELIIKLSSVAENVALFLPRNANLSEFSGFFSILGFQAIEIEAIRDTRYNYFLGLILYCVRTKPKFKIKYLFGQSIDSIYENLITRLGHFIGSFFTKPDLSKEKRTKYQTVLERELLGKTHKKLIRLCKIIENRIKKRGLETLMIITYILNHFIYGNNEKYSYLLLFSQNICSSCNRLKPKLHKYKKLAGKYGNYCDSIINRLENIHQLSDSE